MKDPHCRQGMLFEYIFRLRDNEALKGNLKFSSISSTKPLQSYI